MSLALTVDTIFGYIHSNGSDIDLWPDKAMIGETVFYKTNNTSKQWETLFQ